MDGTFATDVEVRSMSGKPERVEDIDITTTTVSEFTDRFLSIAGADSSSLRTLRTQNGKLDDPSAPLAAHIGPHSPAVYAIWALAPGPNMSHIVPAGVYPPPNACLARNSRRNSVQNVRQNGPQDCVGETTAGGDDVDDTVGDEDAVDDGNPPSPLVRYRIVVLSYAAGYFPDVDSLERMTRCVLRVVGYGKSFAEGMAEGTAEGGEDGGIALEVETTEVPADLVECDGEYGVHLAMDVEYKVPDAASWVWGPNREYEVKVEMYGKERGGVWRFSTRQEGDSGVQGVVTAPELGLFHFEAKTPGGAGSASGGEGIPLPCDQLFRTQNEFAQWEDGNASAFKIVVNGAVCGNDCLSFERIGATEFYVRIVDQRVLQELASVGSVACLVVDKQGFHFTNGAVLAGNVYGVWRTAES